MTDIKTTPIGSNVGTAFQYKCPVGTYVVGYQGTNDSKNINSISVKCSNDQQSPVAGYPSLGSAYSTPIDKNGFVRFYYTFNQDGSGPRKVGLYPRNWGAFKYAFGDENNEGTYITGHYPGASDYWCSANTENSRAVGVYGKFSGRGISQMGMICDQVLERSVADEPIDTDGMGAGQWTGVGEVVGDEEDTYTEPVAATVNTPNVMPNAVVTNSVEITNEESAGNSQPSSQASSANSQTNSQTNSQANSNNSANDDESNKYKYIILILFVVIVSLVYYFVIRKNKSSATLDAPVSNGNAVAPRSAEHLQSNSLLQAPNGLKKEEWTF